MTIENKSNSGSGVQKKIIDELWLNNIDLVNRDFDDYILNLYCAGVDGEKFKEFIGKGKILEVACGEGKLIQDCIELGYDIYGLDIALSKKDFRKRLLKNNALPEDMKGRIYAADAEHIPFKDSSFKAIINRAGAFSYASSPEQMEDSLLEQLRVLEKGGKIFIMPANVENDSGYPLNLVNVMLPKEEKISKEKIEEIENMFGGLIKRMTENGTVEANFYGKREEFYDKVLEKNLKLGVIIITKI